MDLVDYGIEHMEENDGYCYVLNIIDHFSNRAWSYALKSKTKEGK